MCMYESGGACACMRVVSVCMVNGVYAYTYGGGAYACRLAIINLSKHCHTRTIKSSGTVINLDSGKWINNFDNIIVGGISDGGIETCVPLRGVPGRALPASARNCGRMWKHRY